MTCSVTTKVRCTRRVEEGQEEISKLVVEEYNSFMGEVDWSNQLLSYYGFPHCTVKWWRWAMFQLLDMAVVNAYIMYTTSTQSSKKCTHEQFRIELLSSLPLM